jgi:polyhydroxyalkanoate synthase
LLYWFEDGARIPHAFLKSYNRGLLAANALKDGDRVRQSAGSRSTLADVKTPIFLIALKDDHVSAWERGLRRRQVVRRTGQHMCSAARATMPG